MAGFEGRTRSPASEADCSWPTPFCSSRCTTHPATPAESTISATTTSTSQFARTKRTVRTIEDNSVPPVKNQRL